MSLHIYVLNDGVHLFILNEQALSEDLRGFVQSKIDRYTTATEGLGGGFMLKPGINPDWKYFYAQYYQHGRPIGGTQKDIIIHFRITQPINRTFSLAFYDDMGHLCIRNNKNKNGAEMDFSYSQNDITNFAYSKGKMYVDTTYKDGLCFNTLKRTTPDGEPIHLKWSYFLEPATCVHIDWSDMPKK